MLELVTARARTRGKAPQEFTYQGYGKIETRKVMGKDNEPLVIGAYGKAVEPVKDKDGEIVLAEGQHYIEVDDLDVKGIIGEDGLPEVLALFGGNIVELLEAGIKQKNVDNRKAASPVTEVVTDDELTPYVNAMIEAKILDDKTASVWRRTLTGTAKMFEWTRIDTMLKTKEYKALDKAGKVPTDF